MNELRSNEEVKDIANQRRTLKVIPLENENDYTCYYFDSLRSERKIEVFILKYYLKEKLKIEFAPRTHLFDSSIRSENKGLFEERSQ